LSPELAENGAQAVEKARHGGYALILMDVQMPELNGLEATRLIRALPAGRNLPILAMTANTFSEDLEQCLSAGMNDFIAKPVDPKALFSTLLKWLPPTNADRSSLPSESSTAKQTGLIANKANLHIQLSAIDGLDVEQGLERVQGNPETLHRLLWEFFERHSEDLGLLNSNPDETMAIAHKIKGAAGNLGLTRLQQMAAELEAALRAGKANLELTSLIKALATEQARCANALATLRPTEALALPTADPVRAKEVLRELEPLLALCDLEALTIFEEQLPLLRASLDGSILRQLEQEIKAFDSFSALNTVQKVLQETP
jgi:CheY-like chemotaxis protein